ncbi:MAG: tetratricopeptide repeat protein [Candidatus Acetothermia bacterium]|jgi:foldase protein PrsA|nr:tetratricopeptide repeat protein [Candidatus Acetothermia bacterium]
MNRFFQRHKVAIIMVVVVGFVLGSVGLYTFQRFSPAAKGSAEETIMTIEGRKVTRQELAQAYDNLVQYYTQLYRMFGQDFTAELQGLEGAFRRQQYVAAAAEGIIREAILDREAKRLRISVPKAEVDQAARSRYEQILAQFGGDEKGLESYLKTLGLTLDQYRRQLAMAEESRLREERLRQFVVGPIQPTDDQLQAYYTTHQDRYQSEPEKIKVAHILVDEAKLADELLGRVQAAGADFAALAREYSKDEATRDQGGEMDWFARGGSTFSTKVEEAAFGLAPGQVTVVDDEQGFHILKVLDRKAAVIPTFAEVRDQVQKDYLQDEEGKRWNDWYVARRQAAQLVVSDPLLSAALLLGKDKEQAVQVLLSAREAGTGEDPYLNYYIGRLYEDLFTGVGTKRVELEKKAERTPEEEAELERLRAQEADYKAKAVQAYLAFVETGEADEALYQRALALDPRNPQFRYHLAELYRSLGRYVQADTEYRQAIEAKPDFVAAYTGQGDAAMAMELYARAIEAYRKGLELQPGSVTLKLKLAGAYVKGRQYQEAKPLLEEVLAREPENVTALTLMGDLLLAQGDAQRAIVQYEAAYKRNPTSEVQIKLAGGYFAAGRLEDAKRRYQDVIKQFPYRAEAYVGLGDVYLQQGDQAKALDYYRQALPRAFEVTMKETIARKIVELDPKDTTTRFRLAGYFREQYKYEAAIRQYEAILELSPGNLDALVGLGDSYVPRVQYDRAMDYYRQALAVATTSQQRLAIYDKMVACEEQRVGPGQPLGPQGLEALWQRALLEKELGQKDKAKADLERIRAADPNFRAGEVGPLLEELGGTAEPPSQ